MHLLESVSRRLACVPVVHEVAAGIATEYFNATSPAGCRAFSLVTAGPGLTNIVTAMAGAYLESRELLVIGGQVKTEDLSRGVLRQRGIQEIDGIAIAQPVTVLNHLMDKPLGENDFKRLCARGGAGRPGPVFIEFPLDIQARDVPEDLPSDASVVVLPVRGAPAAADIAHAAGALETSTRPCRPHRRWRGAGHSVDARRFCPPARSALAHDMERRRSSSRRSPMLLRPSQYLGATLRQSGPATGRRHPCAGHGVWACSRQASTGAPSDPWRRFSRWTATPPNWTRGTPASRGEFVPMRINLLLPCFPDWRGLGMTGGRTATA